MYYYLIINEGLSNGLTQSQVLSPIKYNSLEERFGVISIERIGRNRNKIAGVKCKILDIGIPYRLFLFNKLAFFLVPTIAFTYALILSFFVKKSDILVARSYFPGIVLLYLNKIKGNTFKFDPRSLFIQECVTKNLLKERSFLFEKWLTWEKQILFQADEIIIVAKEQGEYYEKTVGKKLKLKYIPCYSSNLSLNELETSSLLPFNKEDIVIAYYGSLDGGWNNINTYFEFFENAISGGYKICIISQNYKQLLNDDRFNVPEIFLLNTLMNKNHSDYLQLCDYGVVIMPKVLDWKTRLSVKFVEYLNHGLAVIVGEYVGEAVRLSKEYFNEENVILYNGISEINLNKLSPSSKSHLKEKSVELFGMKNFLQILK